MTGRFGNVAPMNPSPLGAARNGAPHEDVKHDTFMVPRETMRKSGTTAPSRVVIAPSGKRSINHTLRTPAVGLISARSSKFNHNAPRPGDCYCIYRI